MGRSQIVRHPKRVVEDMGPKLLMSCVVDIEVTGLLMHLNMQVVSLPTCPPGSLQLKPPVMHQLACQVYTETTCHAPTCLPGICP